MSGGIGSRIAGRFPRLARHWQVLRAAWTEENVRQGERRRIDNTEFLPAALEVIETPPSPAGRWLIWFLVGMVAIGIVWAFVGRLDVVAVATGRVIPADRVQLIQASELGVVRGIHVREGEHVAAGQLLIELDPTVAGAQTGQASSALLAARLDAARSRAIIARLRGEPGTFVPPEGVAPEAAAIQRTLILATMAEYAAERDSIAGQRTSAEAERAAAQEELLGISETLPLAERQARAARSLAERGISPAMEADQLESTLLERRHAANAARNRVAAAAARIVSTDRQLAQLTQRLLAETLTGLADAENRIAQAAGEVVQTEQRTRLQRIVAPEAGTIQQLQVNTLGGVVQPAGELMTLVPDAGGIVVEVAVLNRDIGFVREGQEVSVKLEAFPFTQYGTVPGRVVAISRDAVQDETLGLIYMTRIRLDRASIRARGRDVPITPGMALQAEIATGRRRIIDYLLSPIARTASEAGRER